MKELEEKGIVEVFDGKEWLEKQNQSLIIKDGLEEFIQAYMTKTNFENINF